MIIAEFGKQSAKTGSSVMVGEDNDTIIHQLGWWCNQFLALSTPITPPHCTTVHRPPNQLWQYNGVKLHSTGLYSAVLPPVSSLARSLLQSSGSKLGSRPFTTSSARARAPRDQASALSETGATPRLDWAQQTKIDVGNFVLEFWSPSLS